MAIEWVLPIELVSPNRKEHWTKSYQRNKKTKKLITSMFLVDKPKIDIPCLVTIERRSPRMFDYVNYISSLKGLQDILASLILPQYAPGHADNPKYGIAWDFIQTKSKKKEVCITIT